MKDTLILLSVGITTSSSAQNDSCSAHANFSLATTDYKTVTITNHSYGNNLAYKWIFSDGATSTLPNPGSHTFNSVEMHYVVLQLTDVSKNCSDFYADTVSMPCYAGFSWTINKQDVKFASSSLLDPNVNTFSWDFGDGTTSILANPSHHYTLPGKYNPCLTVGSKLDLNCYDKSCDYISIKDSIPDTTFCSAVYTSYRKYGYTFAFHATQNDYNYLWNFGDGTTSTLQNPEHTFPSTQYYNVCLTVSSKNTSHPCTNEYCTGIDVNIPNYCMARFSIVPDSLTSDPSDFLIYNQSTGNNLSYLWDFGDGATSTLQNPTHDYSGTGPYRICLSVTTDSCHSTYCDTLDLSDTLHHLISKPFHIKVINKTTGISTNDANKTNLQNYPNPFKGMTTISYAIFTSTAIDLEVYNSLGEKVATLESGMKTPGNYTLNWSALQLQEGIYLLQLRTNDQLIMKKIIISK